MIEVFGLPAFQDNYLWILRDSQRDVTLSVDPGEASKVLEFLRDKDWTLNAILATHHHWDHTDGVLELKKHFNCPVYGSIQDQDRIPGLTNPVSEQECFEINGLKIEVMFVPGHTLGHIAYHFAKQKLLFVGDCLFAMGCGRLFEGTPQQMMASLQKIKRLPAETKIYCGHEYTLKNVEFAEPFMGEHERFRLRKELTIELRKTHQPTVPFLLQDELATSPFFNLNDRHLRLRLKMQDSSDLEVFTELRRQRNSF